MLVYLLNISIFTLCCVYRPLKDLPENYTKADNDKTTKMQKNLKVCVPPCLWQHSLHICILISYFVYFVYNFYIQILFSFCVYLGKLSDTCRSHAFDWRDYQRHRSHYNSTLRGQHYFYLNIFDSFFYFWTFLSGFINKLWSNLICYYFQIPSILRVGAKRYFGQSALGGPFHVTL